MAYPGLPTHVRGKYKYGDQDGELSTWFFCNATGTPIGWIFDDTTPDLETVWIPKALSLASQRNFVVVVLVPPNKMGTHHKGCVNFLEVYWKGIGWSWQQFARQIAQHSVDRYAGYIMQRNYGFQDADWGGNQFVPTRTQYLGLRAALTLMHSKYGLWDY